MASFFLTVTIQYNITLLPSVNTLIARGMFCGAKYTHHTFAPIIKHLITTIANKHPGKKSFIDENMKNPTGIKLPLPEDGKRSVKSCFFLPECYGERKKKCKKRVLSS